MTWVPDGCTLPTEEVPLRVAEFDDLFTTALRGVARPAPRLLRLTFDVSAGIETTARDLIARESACCSFFDFTLGRDRDGQLRLDIAVPAGREPVLDGLARQATTAARGASTWASP